MNRLIFYVVDAACIYTDNNACTKNSDLVYSYSIALRAHKPLDAVHAGGSELLFLTCTQVYVDVFK